MSLLFPPRDRSRISGWPAFSTVRAGFAILGRRLIRLALALIAGVLLLQAPARAQTDVRSSLLEAVGSLPIPGIKDALNAAVNQAGSSKDGTAYNLSINGTKAYLYLLGKAPAMSAVVFVNGTLAIPSVYNNSAWKKLGGASLVDPIFSLSTVNLELVTSTLPEPLKNMLVNSYFNPPSLQFRAGFQMAARFQSGGVMKTILETGMGMPVQNFVMRSGVTIPVPTDAQGQAGLALTLLSDIKAVGTTIKDLPEFYVELQTQPGAVFTSPMGMSAFSLSDATFYLNNQGVFSYTGNMIMNPLGKKFAVFFQTPLSPTGAMDFLDFQFGMAAQDFTLEDMARMVISMKTPKVPGGSFLKDVSGYHSYLTQLLKPLSVVRIYNPKMLTDYRYGDPTRPFPTADAMNLLVLGPLATTEDGNGKTVLGPMLKAMGQARIMSQEVGNQYFYAGPNGFRVNSTAQMSLKLGPLGRQSVSMNGQVDISKQRQIIKLNGNVLGRVIEMNLAPTRLTLISPESTNLTINSPATCATPFAISGNIEIKSDMNLSTVMDGLPGVNVNPSEISGCMGEDLKKALQWVGTTGKSLEGYPAAEANAALKKITDDEARVVAEAYRIAKDQARDKAEQATNDAAKAFKSAGNFVKSAFGKKKKKRQEPKTDERFAGSVFDWDYYYDANPDLVKAGVDLVDHWRRIGFEEGRRGSLEYNPAYYYKYADVQHAANTNNGLYGMVKHWLDKGIKEGLQASDEFSIKAYLARYPDLQKMNWSYEQIFDHWMEQGKAGGRTGAP